MSTYPFNVVGEGGNPKGTPINLSTMLTVAEVILRWHMHYKTSDWSESNTQGEENRMNLALGLMELFSDPGGVERTMAVGSVVRENIISVLAVERGYSGSDKVSLPTWLKQVLRVIREDVNVQIAKP